MGGRIAIEAALIAPNRSADPVLAMVASLFQGREEDVVENSATTRLAGGVGRAWLEDADEVTEELVILGVGQPHCGDAIPGYVPARVRRMYEVSIEVAE